MSSDVFIISAARDANAPAAIRQALESAGVSPSRVQDAVLGLDGFAAIPDVKPVTQAAGLSCPAACILTSGRALFFAAASMLSDDTQLSLVIGMDHAGSTAFVLASPEAVGWMNLLPRARIAARSLNGPEPALESAGIGRGDVEIVMHTMQAALSLYDLLDMLETKQARWGMVAAGEALILVERV
jgi:hypothetical protein